MIDKNLLFKYYQHIQDTGTNITYNNWIGKNDIDIEGDDEITKEELINKIIDEKNTKKGINKIYSIFSKFYKDKDEYQDILN